MHFTDNHEPPSAQRTPRAFWRAGHGWALVTALAGAGLVACNTPAPAPRPPVQATPALRPTPVPAVRPVAPVPAAAPAARSAADYRLQAARKLVAANPGQTYTGEVPEPLLAIPVLEVELHADGSIAKINVLRQPSQAKDTTQMAIDAVKRAAPFGDVSRLPKPWRYTEAFLFRDDRKFKPRTLD